MNEAEIKPDGRLILATYPKVVGYWNMDDYLRIANTRRPNLWRRLNYWIAFGWKWEDAE